MPAPALTANGASLRRPRFATRSPSVGRVASARRSGLHPGRDPIRVVRVQTDASRAITASVNSVVPAWPPRSGVRMPAATVLEDRLVDRARGRRSARRVVEQRRGGEDHRHRVGEVLALERGRRAVRRLGHRGARAQLVVEGEQHRLGAGDRAEQRQDEVGEQVAVAVEARDHQRPGGGAGDEPGEGGVDQHRLVGDLRVARGGRVHLLLQHPLVDRAHGPFRPAVHAPAEPLGLAEGVLGDRPAVRAAGSSRCGGRARRRRRPRATPRPRRRRRPPSGRPRSGGGRRRPGSRPGSAGRYARSPCRRSPRAGSGSGCRRRRRPRA